MSLLYNTGDWFTLGHGNSFRKIEIYNMDWPTNINIENMTVCGAPYGGPIAMIRDNKQIIKLTGTAQTKPVIRIFNCSGKAISTINWDKGNLVCLGWSNSEDLLCIQDDGLVLIYDMFGNYTHTFSMGQEAKDTKIFDAKVFPSESGTGVAVMTTNYRVFIVNSVTEPKTRLLPELLKSTSNPNCWEILTSKRNTCSMVARDKELFLLRQGDSVCIPQNITMKSEFSSIVMMSVSFDHRHLAIYTDTGSIWIGSSDLKTKYCEFNTGRSDKPKQIEWCLDFGTNSEANSHAVVLAYTSILLVVGTNGDSNVYTYEPAIVLIPELDGVRVLTNNYHEMIQKVPKCTSNIFGINISEAASFLFEAHRKFKEKSHQSDEYLCLIIDKLEQAVGECVLAAGYEFDTDTQKSLIRAAYFGKGFIAGHNPYAYIKMCRILRVLNALRHPNIGIPLTLEQFEHLKANVILDRLVFRRHYGLSIQIAKHLKLPKSTTPNATAQDQNDDLNQLSESRILEHWAFHKIKFDKNDDEVAKKISEKFLNHSTHGRVSFCNVAKKAQEIGKTKLAITLLDLEPKKSLQVPLLLKLGANKKALLAATQSGDTELVYMVLSAIKETTQLADFLMTIRSFPLAHNLYKKYCQLHNLPAIKDIYSQEDDFLSQAETCLKEGIESNSVDASLPIASNSYKKANKLIEADLCDESKKLLKHQKAFDLKYTKHFYGLSVHQTIRQLLIVGDIKQAEKLKSEFKVPDRRYWWLRIQVISEQFQWDELEKFSKLKKSPIGYEPFVQVCLMQRNVDEAKKYLQRCSEDRKFEWYSRAGLHLEAALIAFEHKDLQSLYKVHSNIANINDRMLANRVENLIEQLSTKR